MRRLLFLLLASISLGNFAGAQTTQTAYIFPSISSMKTYFGSANRAFVSATKQEFVICTSCTADESTVYAGAGGRKWEVIGGGVDRLSARVVYLSKVGVVSNADLSQGSSTFGTDQTAAVQAILNTGGSTPLHIINDTRFSTTGLSLKSNTEWTNLPGCGFILRDGADNQVVRNYNWTANNNNIVDSNITIIGGIINGNGFRGGVAKQIHSTPSEGMMTILNFYGVKDLTLGGGLELRNGRTYAGFFTTTENLHVDNIIIDQGSAVQVNQDGFDIVGRLKGCVIENVTATCADDVFAFGSDAVGGGNASNGGDLNVNTGVAGVQENIRINNIVLKGEGKGLRFNSATTEQRDINVSNISGTARTSWLYIESENNIAACCPLYVVPAGPGNIKNATFENIHVTITQLHSYDYVPDHHGEVQIGGNFENLTFRNITRNNFTLAYPSFAIHRNHGTVVGNGLIIDEYKSKETGTTYSGHHIIFDSLTTVSNFNLINSRVIANGNNGANLIYVRDGATLNQPVINNTYTYDLFRVVGNDGAIDLIKSSGLTHLGNSQPAFATSTTISNLVLSNYQGATKTAGTFTATSGDAYAGGGGGNLQAATDAGNTTTNDIEFSGSKLVFGGNAVKSSYQNIGGGLHISTNAYFNGTTWVPYSTADTRWNSYYSPGDAKWVVRYAPSGSGLTWSNVFELTGAGIPRFNGLGGHPGTGFMGLDSNGVAFWQAAPSGSSGTLQSVTTGSGNNATTNDLFLNNSILQIGGTGSQAALKTALQNIGGGAFLTANAYFNGSAWVAYESTTPKLGFYMDPISGKIVFRKAGASTGATWANLMEIDANSGEVKAVNIGYPRTYAGTGDNNTATFQFAHGLTGVTSGSIVLCSARTSTTGLNDALGTFIVKVDATYVYVIYSGAPPAPAGGGTNNLRWDFIIYP